MYSITPPLSTTPDYMSLDTGDMDYNTSQFTRVTAWHQKNTDVTILTAENDKVTLLSSSQSQATYVAYDSLAPTKVELTWFQGESFGLRVIENFPEVILWIPQSLQ